MTKHSFKLWNPVKIEYMKTCGEYSLELLSEAVLMSTCFCNDISHVVVFCLELSDFIRLGIMAPPNGAHEVDGCLVPLWQSC